MTVTVATLGFPRMGPRRELKFALESHWSGKTSEAELLEAVSGLCTAAWAQQKALGADWLPSNDFSLYDHVLDMSVMLGAVPARYGAADGQANLATYFAMARGTAGVDEGCSHGHGSLTACEMTKWFDTNYHYMVPELVPGQRLALGALKVVDEYREAKAQGYETRPVLLGPVTWLSLAKGRGVDPFDFLDEPTNDLDVETLRALEDALESFAGCAVVISHDRFFLDRLATHILAFEGDGHVEWFEGNFESHQKDKRRRLGDAADRPGRGAHKRLTR
jgi:hypothetical protein